jgi:hypothetical protein
VKFTGFRGRNPLLRLWDMFTGTVIRDLMATVEQVERRLELQHAAQLLAKQQRIEQEELHAIFSMQIPVVLNDRVYMGAA